MPKEAYCPDPIGRHENIQVPGL